MLKHQMIKTLSIVLIGAFLFAACNKADEKADVNVRMTDAPALYNEVNVDIQSVEMHTDNGWQALNVNAGVYNLLDFTNGNDTLIASSQLEPGEISQIRLILGSNNTAELISGQVVELTTPSAQQSGLKLLVNQEIEAGATYTFLLDFDAARSIVVTGSSKYILKPTIKVILEQNSGSISGVVDPASSNPAIYAIAGNDTSTTFADSNGGFMVNGLTPDDYDVTIFPSSGGYQDTTITNVTVTKGQDNNIGTISLQ